MGNTLKSKRVWIVTLVFLLFAGVCYADYTMPDGTVVKWVSGNTLQVISPDGSSHLTTGERSDTGRLVPVDNSVNKNAANQIPAQNSATQGGMNNTTMSVPIINNGQVTGYADIYGNGTAYQGTTAVRNSNENLGNTVTWNGIDNGYGGGVIHIITPSTPTPPPLPRPSPSSPPVGGGPTNIGGSSKPVSVVQPPAATPPDKPPVRLY